MEPVSDVVVGANLIASLVALAAAMALTARRWMRDRHLSRLLVVDVLAVVCVVSLVGGALFQAGFIERDPWMTVRLILVLFVAAGLLALLLDIPLEG
jgi:uncharacterized membrane protein YhaH (DUF805 family)